MRSHAKAATAGSTKRLGRSKPALLLCVLAASVAALALVVGSASGATTRFLVEVFGSSAQPTFPADRGMAFDQGSSQLYVIDSTNDTISRFNADGTAADFGALGSNTIDGVGAGDETPLGHLAFEANRQREQIAIDESGGATDGNVYATRSASDVVDVFSSTGEYKGTLSESTGTGAFGEPCGVAVDDEGTVYVGDRGDDRIHVYDPAGAVPINADNTASFATVTDPCTLAAGMGATDGFLFVNASTGAQLRKLDAATGEVKYEIATGGSTVSVDPATGHVFVARNTFGSSSVDEYDASGAAEATLVSSFKPGQTVEGIALNSGAEQVYVARASTENVEVFGPAAIIPDVVTSPPSSNTGTRATLAGTVNPDGVELDECFFEWGRATSQGGEGIAENTTPCAQSPATIGAGTAPVAVSAAISGLTPQGGAYQYRLVAANPNATVNGSNQDFTTPTTVINKAASGITPTAVTLNGTVNPDEETLSACLFEWGPEQSSAEQYVGLPQEFPKSTPCVPGPGSISGSSPVSVQAEVSGLHPGTRYVYRLKATYPGGTITTAPLSVGTSGPRIVAAWSDDVVFEEATLKARINPAGKATTYRFEYGPTEAYGSETPEIEVGSGSEDHVVTRFLTGLAPDATYHYRAIATNADAVNEGPDLTFTTYERFAANSDCPNQALRLGFSANLPDCRAYEMVTPLDKNGGAGWNRANLRDLQQSTPDGGKLTYSSRTAFGSPIGAPYVSQYIATRGAAGWSSENISPEWFSAGGETAVLSPFYAFTTDLSSAWHWGFTPLNPGEEEGTSLYRLGVGDHTYEPLNKTTSIPGRFVGASEDLKHQIFESNRHLLPEAAVSGQKQLYDFSGGELHLVNFLPDGSAVKQHAFSDPTGSNYKSDTYLINPVSEDGSRVFWVTGSTFDGGKGTVYVRENPAEPQSALSGEECTEPEKACTYKLSPAGAGLVRLLATSRDGTSALIGTGEGKSLWRVDVETKSSTLIAGELSTFEPPSAERGSSGVVGASEDLSYVYFSSEEALAPGATAGEANLYLDHEGEKTFIASLSPLDSGEKGLKDSSGYVFSPLSLRPLTHVGNVAPDGRSAVFTASDPRLGMQVAGYDNADVASGKAAYEVYLFRAGEGLVCVSCNPSGARPEAGQMEVVFEGEKAIVAAFLSAPRDGYHAPRVLSADGDRVFFNSFDALLPRDTNGIQDVYQWEAPGTGDCDKGDPSYSERNKGCISLISTGVSAEDSGFLEASEDGSDVFFFTDSSIDPRDPRAVDIYDARVGGGYPVPIPPPACEGDACQNIPSTPPAPSPASANFKAAGDPVSARNCATAGRAAKLARQAKRLRRAAKRSATARRSKRLRRRSAALAKRAKRLSRSAKRCRSANRRVSR